MAMVVPGISEWVAGTSDPLLHCTVVNTHTLLTVNIALPLLMLWAFERQSRARFEQERAVMRAGAAAGAAGDATQLQPPRRAWWEAEEARVPGRWLLDVYLISCALWSAVCLYYSAAGR